MLQYGNTRFGVTHYQWLNDDKPSLCFEPRLNVQRYSVVKKVIEDFPVNCVAEFGTATHLFFRNCLLECDFLDTVHLIDIDENVINSGLYLLRDVVHRRPEYRQGRNKPLIVNVFRGNVAEKDDRVLNAEIVIGIELIEHLEPEDFDKFPENVFGFMRPGLVILTTPNYDFNVLFENDGAFRHKDHKFEFTRQQFQDWADGIVRRYPNYRVRIYGIGTPPECCQLDVGCCSQMAVFERIEIPKEQPVTTQSFNEYNLLGSFYYFIFYEFYTRRHEIIDRVSTLTSSHRNDDHYVKKFLCQGCRTEQISCLPLQLFHDRIENCPHVDTLKSILEKFTRLEITSYDNVPYLIVEQCYHSDDFLNE